MLHPSQRHVAAHREAGGGAVVVSSAGRSVAVWRDPLGSGARGALLGHGTPISCMCLMGGGG